MVIVSSEAGAPLGLVNCRTAPETLCPRSVPLGLAPQHHGATVGTPGNGPEKTLSYKGCFQASSSLGFGIEPESEL